MYFKGQGNKKDWGLRDDQVSYLENFYKDNPLYKLGLLDIENIRPYHLDPQSRGGINSNTYGYTYPWIDDNLYVQGIETLNDEIDFSRTLHQKGPQFPTQEYFDNLNIQKARTGSHEAIHNKLFGDTDNYNEDNYFSNEDRTGAYPNAIAEMLRGTSALGQPGDTTGFMEFGNQYDWYPTGKPHPGFESYKAFDGSQVSYIDDEPMWQEYESEGWAPTGTSPSFEQNELLTQQINKLIHPEDPGNWWGGGATVYPADGFNFHAMDRPGQGPLSYEHYFTDDDGRAAYTPYSNESPMALFLDKVSAPFYKQLLSDAEKGYVQDSIWSTAAYGQKPGSTPDASRVHTEQADYYY